MKNVLFLLKMPDPKAEMNELSHLMTKNMGLCAKEILFILVSN